MLGYRGLTYSISGQTITINAWLDGALGDFPLEQNLNLMAMNYRNSLSTLFQEIENLNGGNTMNNNVNNGQMNFDPNTGQPLNQNMGQQPTGQPVNQMNKDKIFLKTKYDGLWESNPHIAFLPCMFGGIIGLFVFLFLGIITDSFISVLCYILGIIFLVVIGILLPVKKNNENNISKSIAFIKRDNKWYAIKLMYDYADAGLMFYAPSGSILQVATLPHNISVAIKTQGQEKYIKKLRQVEKNYSDALDGILESLKDNNYSKPIYAGVDQKIDYFLNKYCFNEIYISKKKLCGYIILNNPKIDNIDNKFITITFTDENENQKTMKFRNAYDGLVEELKKEMR